MISVTVKTLTGTDHKFEVSEELSIERFKETISSTVNVPPERQRLIFQGRVLRNDQVLSNIGVDQRTIHLVEQLPGASVARSAGSSPLLQRRGGAGPGATGGQNVGQLSQHQVVMGAVSLPSGELSRDQIASCLRRILNRLGDIGRRAELQTRESPDGSSVQADIRLRTQPTRESSTERADGFHQIDGPATQRVEHIRHILRHMNHILEHLENDDGEIETEQRSSSDGTQQQPDTAAAGDPFSTCCSVTTPPSAAAPAAGASTENAAESSSTTTTDSNFDIEYGVINGEELAVRETPIRGLGSLLDEILRLEDRLRPHLTRYNAMLREDRDYTADGGEAESRRASRLFNSVQTILHNLAHVFHSYSDLNVHFCQPPPRNLYPQLVGRRLPPPGQAGAGTLRQGATTIQTTAEVQITMNFQRGSDDEQGASPPPHQPVPPPPWPTIPGFPPFPNIRVDGAGGGNGAAYTTVDISPNAVTVNQVTARIEPHAPGSTVTSTPVASTLGSAGQQQQRPPMPPPPPQNILQQLMQGFIGGGAAAAAAAATGGTIPGGANVHVNFGMPPPNLAAHLQRFALPQQAPAGGGGNVNLNFGGPNFQPLQFQRFAVPQQPPARPMQPAAATAGLRFRMPGAGAMPQQHFGGGAAPAGFRVFRPPGVQPGDGVFTGIFTAARHSGQASTQPAVFVGNDPPLHLPLYTFDEFLPCASRHFDPRQHPSLYSASRRQRGGGLSAAQTTGAGVDGGADAADATAATTESATNVSEVELDFERTLEPVVRSVVTGLRESIARQTGATSREGLWQFIPIFATGHAAPHQTNAGGLLANRLSPSSAADSTAGMRRPSSDPNLVQRAPNMPGAGTSDRDVIEGLVRDVYSNMMGNSRETLGDYLRSMGHEFERCESVLVDTLQTVMLSLSFSDIWALFANDSRPLDRSRSVLRRHFIENLLNGNESPSEEDLRSAAARAATTDLNVWREMTADTETVEDLDFAATMMKCEEAFLLDVLLMVFGHTFNATEEFGRPLYDRLWLFAREAVTAALICCANGEQGFEQFANRVVTNTMRQVSEDFHHPFATAGVQHLRTLSTQHRLERAAVECYLVKKNAAAAAEGPSIATVSSDQTVVGSSSASHAESDVRMDTGNAGSASVTAGANEKNEAAASSRNVASERSAGSSEDWKRQLPEEWVQVMQTDIDRQQNQSPQKPFSDAYLNGMPSKRRKLLYDQRPRAILNAASTSTDAFLKEVLRQSIADTGVNTITGEQVEDILEHVSVYDNGPELLDAFASNVEQRFGNRLRAEQIPNKEDNNKEQQQVTGGKDFDPARFPNASDRFLNS